VPKCFVIQPFDRGRFDKRFDDTFSPAIKAAGLEPYRVDRDPSISIPIDQIEAGIREADVCLADISNDNPNVWFELGFAIASNKDVCLICSAERTTQFPFDVQHRAIIKYQTESKQDYEKLQQEITERLRALVAKGHKIASLGALSPVKETSGLASHEIAALATVMQNRIHSNFVWPHSIRTDMERAGYTDLAVSLALESLKRKGLLKADEDFDRDGDKVLIYSITGEGVAWLLNNEAKLNLRIERTAPRQPAPDLDDEIPF
jgi:nucleoside 2-deoxyribosyltransferase